VSDKKEIWQRSGEIERARRDKQHELMEAYDRTVYYPAMKQLREECSKLGHSDGKFHNNGFGWTWFYCGSCGGRYNIEGPDGKSI
jgi:hypothetical protein